MSGLFDETVAGALGRARNVLTLFAFVSFVFALKIGWLAVLLVALVVVPPVWKAIRDLRKAGQALELLSTWSEGIYGGVRWGWRPGLTAEEVLGPYCPKPRSRGAAASRGRSRRPGRGRD